MAKAPPIATGRLPSLRLFSTLLKIPGRWVKTFNGLVFSVARNCYSFGAMLVHCVNPILNVSNIAESFEWFQKWGWKRLWDWGTFGAVGAGMSEIFLCQGGQGGFGKGANTNTFGPNGDQQADKGVWMSVFVDDVDEVHKQCMAEGLDVTFAPADMPWNVREMHVRHPDGHVFRVSQGLEAGA